MSSRADLRAGRGYGKRTERAVDISEPTRPYAVQLPALAACGCAGLWFLVAVGLAIALGVTHNKEVGLSSVTMPTCAPTAMNQRPAGYEPQVAYTSCGADTPVDAVAPQVSISYIEDSRSCVNVFWNPTIRNEEPCAQSLEYACNGYSYDAVASRDDRLSVCDEDFEALPEGEALASDDENFGILVRMLLFSEQVASYTDDEDAETRYDSAARVTDAMLADA